MNLSKITQVPGFLMIIFLLLAGSSPIMAQEAESDTTETKADNLPTDPPKRFSLVFNRGFSLPGPAQDTVPISSTGSGTYFLGGGFRFPLGIKNIVGIRATPGLAWTSYSYQRTVDQTFPSIQDSLPFGYTQEKHRMFFLEMPLGVYINFTRDEDGDPLFFGEFGGFVGYLSSAEYRIRYRNGSGQRIEERTRDLEQISDPEIEFERLRYGAYARLGYKWITLYYSIRLTDVFDEFTNPSLRPKDVEGFKNPTLPPMEIGISLFL